MNSAIIALLLLNLAFALGGPLVPADDAPCSDKLAFCKPHVLSIKETFDEATNIGLTYDQIKARVCQLRKAYKDCLEWFNHRTVRCAAENSKAMQNDNIDSRLDGHTPCTGQ